MLNESLSTYTHILISLAEKDGKAINVNSDE